MSLVEWKIFSILCFCFQCQDVCWSFFFFYDKWPTSGEFLASLHEHRIKHLHKKNDPVLFFYKKINLSDKMYKKRRNTYTYICFGLPVWAAPTLYETVYIKGVIQWYMCQKIQILSNKC